MGNPPFAESRVQRTVGFEEGPDRQAACISHVRRGIAERHFGRGLALSHAEVPAERGCALQLGASCAPAFEGGAEQDAIEQGGVLLEHGEQ